MIAPPRPTTPPTTTPPTTPLSTTQRARVTATRRMRAFTLLEMVIALALGAIILTAAVLILAQVVQANRRQHFISELQRDGQFVNQLFETELRQAGLGVPTKGFMIMQDCTVATPPTCNFIYGTNSNTLSGNAAQLSFAATRLLVAAPSDIGMLGDIARPDSNYNAFGPLDSRATGNQTTIAWHTENNGSCVPPGCVPAANTSLFFPALANCASGSLALTCPWASRRLAPNERLQIVAGDNNWSISAAGSPINATNANPNNIVSLPLAQSFDLGNGVPQPVWPNDSPGAAPQGLIGQGWVTTLDRVFFHYNAANKTIERIWCTGDPDPNNPKWPPSGVNALPAGFTYTAPSSSGMSGKTVATVCNGGGPNEVVARRVQSLTFSYFDASGNPVVLTPTSTAATLNTIARVNWQIVFNVQNAVAGSPIDFKIEGATVLQN